MTGDEEGQWMSDRFEQGMRDVPDTLAPHDAIETGGRARRRRRAAVGGAIAAVLVAAGTATAIGLTSGGDGEKNVASGTSQTVSSAGQPTPATADVPYAEDLGKVTIAKGEVPGHTWELVRVRSYGAYPAKPGAPLREAATPTGTPTAVTRGGYCEMVELNLDGKLANRGGGTCGEQPVWRLDGGKTDIGVSALGLGDTALYKSGVGKLGTLSFGKVPQNVAKVVATFDKDKATVEAATQKVAGDTYYVLFVPSSAGHGDSATVRAYDANGTQVGKDQPNMGVGNGK